MYRTIYVYGHLVTKILVKQFTTAANTIYLNYQFQQSSRPKPFPPKLDAHMDRSGVNTCQLALNNTHAKVSTIVIPKYKPVSLFIPVLATLKLLNVDDLDAHLALLDALSPGVCGHHRDASHKDHRRAEDHRGRLA